MTMSNSRDNNVCCDGNKNVVRLCGSSTSSCGYCQGQRASVVGKPPENCSKSYGILASWLTPSIYEALLNRGWRRSGLHIYKPDNWQSCCPALTIRLKTDKFQISKSQKRVLRNMERALNPTCRTEKKQQPKAIDSQVMEQLQTTTYRLLKDLILVAPEHVSLLDMNMCRYKGTPHKKSAKSNKVTVFCTVCAGLVGRSKGALQRNILSRQLAVALEKEHLSFVAHVSAHEPSGQIQVTLFNEAVIHDNSDDDDMSIPTKTNDPIHTWLQTKHNVSSISPPYSLTITTVPAHESALQPDVHRLYFQYQQEIHGDPDPLLTEEEEDWGGASPLYVEKTKTMLRTIYSPVEFRKMSAAMSSFYRFLVESPIPYTSNENNEFGTVHQHYRIEGYLIGVGVVDLLPRGLSSVYAFYDPLFSRDITALGKYMSLREIQEKREYYYLGYYIESCPKMRYKAEYRPSELLCPYYYEWVDAAQAQAVIQSKSPKRHCCALFKSEDGEDEMNRQQQQDALLGQVCLDVGAESLVTVNMLHAGGQEIVRPLVQEFIQEVGPDLSLHFVLKLV